MPAREHFMGKRFGRLGVGALHRVSSDGKWTRHGRLVRLRPILTVRRDGFILSLVAWRHVVGVAVFWGDGERK